jgi:hypothetical protein
MIEPEDEFRRLAKGGDGDFAEFWLVELAAVVFLVAMVGLLALALSRV